MSKPRILLLEDEPLILMDLEMSAEDLGCEPLLATRLDDALTLLAREKEIAAAVLDFTLPEGENCIPVARELEKRAIPYLVHSGDLNRVEEKVRTLNAPMIQKPACSKSVVERALGLIGAPAGNA